MRRHALFLGLWFLGLGAFALISGWAFFSRPHLGHGWRDLGALWPYVLGGVVVVAALAAFLMWLAFYSANHGYDERLEEDGP